MFNKKDPEETASRHDQKSTPLQDSEDLLLKEKVEGNKDAEKIKKIAQKIEQGP